MEPVHLVLRDQPTLYKLTDDWSDALVHHQFCGNQQWDCHEETDVHLRVHQESDAD